jgi:hypothetical protein
MIDSKYTLYTIVNSSQNFDINELEGNFLEFLTFRVDFFIKNIYILLQLKRY